MVDPVYVLVMIVAIVTGIVLARQTQIALPLTPREKFFIGLGAFCGAMIGAKLPFVLSDWDGFLSGLAWFSNGKTILCGLIGGYFGVELAKWLLGVRIKTGDSFAVPVAAAVGIGRLGCFHAGCCYGTPTTMPWGMKFTELGHEITGVPTNVPLHPTQLYESFAMLLVFFFLLWLFRHRRFSGQVILAYALLYAAIRFVIEFFRDDPRGDLLGLTTLTGLSTSQLIGIAVAVAALIATILRWRNAGSTAKADRVAASTPARA